MGSYTTNYNLYKPDVGETGWGEEVNQNFDIIDNTLHSHELDIEDLKKKLQSFVMISRKLSEKIIVSITTQVTTFSDTISGNWEIG